MTIVIAKHWLIVAAVILFVLAALPTGWRIRCEWLAAACLTAAIFL